jgi:hypothetical protein
MTTAAKREAFFACRDDGSCLPACPAHFFLAYRQ